MNDGGSWGSSCATGAERSARSGAAAIGRSRTQGLRREEVASFAAVSVTWYTWLEQGREINASRQVLEAVARVLHLTAAENSYLRRWAATRRSWSRTSPRSRKRPHSAAAAGPWTSRPSPWPRTGGSRLEPGLRRPVFAHSGRRAGGPEPALADFHGPHLREMLPDWEETSRHFVAEFRAEAGARLGSAAHTALIARLAGASPEFAQLWADRGVVRFASRQRVFLHPEAGRLVYDRPAGSIGRAGTAPGYVCPCAGRGTGSAIGGNLRR